MAIKISEVVIACFKIKLMVHFYHNVFNIDFRTTQIQEIYIYSGDVGEVRITLCPAHFAGIIASDNRHQLTFLTKDIHDTVQKTNIYGGAVMQKIKESQNGLLASIYDVDGNSIVLHQPL